jgi:hypothetical protein
MLISWIDEYIYQNKRNNQKFKDEYQIHQLSIENFSYQTSINKKKDDNNYNDFNKADKVNKVNNNDALKSLNIKNNSFSFM